MHSMTSSAFLAIFDSVWQWAIILLFGLLLFGSRLPSVARNMGKGINEFKKGLNEGKRDDEQPDDSARGGSSGGSSIGSSTKKSSIDDTSV